MSEHEEKKPHPKYHFFVDAKRYETDDVSLTGAQIKSIANIDPTYQLFLEETGDHPDRALSDGEAVNLEHQTKHFYAVPPATFGGA
jgi:hypothetical protein